jgi:hypothetical protein
VSAAARRRPARWTGVVRAETTALLGWRAVPLTMLAVVLLTIGPFFAQWEGPFSEFRQMVLMMFFFPLLHWRGRAGRGSLDLAMPVDAVRYDLLRVACGTLLAALTLGTAAALHAWNMARLPDEAPITVHYPASYPLSLSLIGVASYLFGSAVVLRTARPGRMLLGVFIAASVAMVAMGVELERYGREVRYAGDRSLLSVTYTTSLTLTHALAAVACGAAAVLLAVVLGRRTGEGRWRATAPAVRPAPAPVRVNAARLRTPRSPAGAATVAAWEFAAQAPRMAWPVLAAGLYAVWLALREMGNGPTFLVDSLPFLPFWFAAFFLPVLVWSREQVAGDWDRARPADGFTQRLLQALAGLAWLQISVHLVLAGCIGGALAAGTLASLRQVPAWAWPGLPLCATALYCLGSVPAMLSRHPVRWSIIAFLVLPQVLMATVGLYAWSHGMSGVSPFAPARLFAMVGFAPAGSWSGAAALVWVPVFAAVAAIAVRGRVRREREGRFA